MSLEPEAGRDGGDGERRAPCLDDARRAAAVLGGAGASRVLVYGSVARGDQRPGSDIDLVAIFDDLDYDKRSPLQKDLCKRAKGATGREVDVHLTDWPEWTMRTQNVSSSFEAHIANEAVVVWDREPGAVRWGKPMVRPASNLEQAEDHLEWVTCDLARVRTRLEGYLKRPPLLMEQPRVGREDHSDVGFFCRDATFVLWRAVCVMMCLSGGRPPRLPRDLDFAGFVAALPPVVRAACTPGADEVAKIDVSDYESWCGNPMCCFPTAPGSETVEIARALSGAAARAAVDASEQTCRALADADHDSDTALRRHVRPERDAREVLSLLKVWDPPITGAAPVAPAERDGPPSASD